MTPENRKVLTALSNFDDYEILENIADKTDLAEHIVKNALVRLVDLDYVAIHKEYTNTGLLIMYKKL
jgi:DNA-binding MarR family transcriptional regulator